MPFPFLGLAICAVCGWGCKKVHDIYKQNQKSKREKYSIKSKNIDQENKKIEDFQAEKNDWKKKYEEIEEKEKKKEQEVRDIKEELKDPNLDSKKRGELEEQLASIITSQEDYKNEKKKIFDKIKGLDDNIKNSQNIISNTLSNLDEKHWIKEFLTLENALIVAGCYVLWQLIKEEKR